MNTIAAELCLYHFDRRTRTGTTSADVVVQPGFKSLAQRIDQDNAEPYSPLPGKTHRVGGSIRCVDVL